MVSASIWLNKLISWDGGSQDINQVLTAAFGAGDYLDCIKDLRARGIDPLSYINSLDKVRTLLILRQYNQFIIAWGQIIDSLPIVSDLRKRCIRALRKTSGIYGILPASHTVTFPLSKPGPRCFSSGGFTDIWKLEDETDRSRIFAVKSFRVCEQDPVENINKV